MSKRVRDLEQRVWQLEQRVRSLETASQTPVVNKTEHGESIPNEVSYEENNEVLRPAINNYNAPEVNTQRQITYPSQQRPNPEKRAQTGNIDLEGRMGKQVMGVVASLLIFIGLCSLAVLIYPYLNEETKFAVMYILSLGTLTAGLLSHKKLNNYFTISLVGCGVGMIYISFLLSRLYFQYINDYVLYGLFFLWVLSTLYLSKRFKTILFNIIGYIGIGVSVIFGAAMVFTWQEMIFLNIYQLVCIMTYLLAKTDNTKINQICLSALAVVLSIIQFMATSYNWWDQGLNIINTYLLFSISTIILILPVLVTFIWVLRKMDKGTAKTAMLIIMYFGIGILAYNGGITLGDGIYMEDPSNLALVCLFVLWLTLLILLESTEKNLLCRITFLVTLAFTYILYVIGDYSYLYYVNNVIGLLPFVAGTLFFAIKKKELVYAYVGFVMTYINSLMTIPYLEYGFVYGWLPEILIVISLIGLFIIMQKWDALQKTGWKILTHIALLLSIFMYIFDSEYSDYLALAVLVMGSIHLLVTFSGFSCKWEKLKDIIVRKGEENRTILSICQIMSELILIIILLTLYEVGQLWLHWALVLLASAYCMANMAIYIKRQHPKEWMGYVYGLRITITVLAIVFSFISWSQYEIVGSLIALCLALIFILVGFKIKQKTLRLSGIFLTMICVLKLILIDINYENSIMRVVGFIAAGIICFAISWLYNRANRKLKDSESTH